MQKQKGSGEIVVAEDSPHIKIAVMNNDIKHINESLNRIESKFDSAIQSFATNQQLTDAIATSESKHKEYDRLLTKLETSVETLKEVNERQQGSIDANKSSFNRTIAIITVIAVILGALWWVPSLLHK
jgi:predicted  nucleic acid-binding Zn-ribbon protein